MNYQLIADLINSDGRIRIYDNPQISESDLYPRIQFLVSDALSTNATHLEIKVFYRLASLIDMKIYLVSMRCIEGKQ